MNCDWEEYVDGKGRPAVRCKREGCGNSAPTKGQPVTARCKSPSAPQRPMPLLRGPGTELARLIAELGVKERDGCRCRAWAVKMNAWGPDGCLVHRKEILAHLRAAYAGASWAEAFVAGGRAVLLGLPLSVEGLLALAVERSRV